MALHLDDIVHGSGRRGDVRLHGHKSARGIQWGECEHAGHKSADDQELGHAEFLQTPPGHNKAGEGIRFRVMRGDCAFAVVLVRS